MMLTRFSRGKRRGGVSPAPLEAAARACVTCGQPVEWMAQHRACWQWERAHGITAENARRIARMKARAA